MGQNCCRLILNYILPNIPGTTIRKINLTETRSQKPWRWPSSGRHSTWERSKSCRNWCRCTDPFRSTPEWETSVCRSIWNQSGEISINDFPIHMHQPRAVCDAALYRETKKDASQRNPCVPTYCPNTMSTSSYLRFRSNWRFASAFVRSQVTEQEGKKLT